MENPNKDESSLKTFNTAKKFAEDVLFPLMFDFKRFQRQSNFGSEKLNDALEISEEMKEIQRFNGLKAMIETVHDLLYSISSTVKLKGNKEENKKLEEFIIATDQIKGLFYNNRERFFTSVYKESKTVEILDRNYFEQIRDIIDVLYVNTEILMTRNKLLFADSNDEYMSDEDIKEAIKKEYIEN
jgi:anionic cell wall polymer biosynthesis LytR-Cps2A-Psr (LCP) family protein